MRLAIIAGARPNFMKIAPIIRAIKSPLRKKSNLSFSLVHTDQHYDYTMSKLFFEELQLPEPDSHLNCGGGSNAEQTAKIMVAFESYCLKNPADWVVVVGDVNSTLACSITAAKLGIPIAHVEAGLRSFDRTMPEEINRIITDRLAALLFTPSADADQNLIAEGVSPAAISLVGNVMIDSLIAAMPAADAKPTLKTLGLCEQQYVYVTLHRPSNVDHKDSLLAIVRTLEKLSASLPVIWPIHPRTKRRINEFSIPLRASDKLLIVEPFGYYDSLNLMRHARFVLTDSGGMQEETTYFRTPCLTLRPNTERPVTISIGSNRLTSSATLANDIEGVLQGPARKGNLPPLWDGRTAERLVDALINFSAAR